MRIAVVSAHYAPVTGGVESHVEEIAKRLASSGQAVEVFTHHDDPGSPVAQIRDGVLIRRHTVAVTGRHFALSPAMWAALRRQRERFDVVHVHGYHSSAPLAGALAGAAPLVFTPHYHGTGHSPLRKALHPPYRVVAAGIVARADRVICVSPAERALFLRHFPSARERTTVIPNGVDVDRIASAKPFPDTGTVVVTGGRLESYKHVDRVVEAMAYVPRPLHLVVTGDGPERDRLEALAERRGLSGRVSFVGQVGTDALYRWYASARVFCSMSSNEAFSITILELLAAGARIVASDIPAHRDLLQRAGGAISLIPLDAGPMALAAAMQAAWHSPAAHEQQIPTWDEVTSQTMDVYRDVVSDSALP